MYFKCKHILYTKKYVYENRFFLHHHYLYVTTFIFIIIFNFSLC